MLRTQIYLPKELHEEIRFLALKEKKTAAQIIRETLKKGLGLNKKKETVGDVLLRIASLGGHGPKDLSKNHDKYLYDE